MCAGRSLSSAHGSVLGAHGERSARYVDFAVRAVRAARGRDGRIGSVEHRGPPAKLMRGEHRLVVLLLVLGDHAEDEAALEQAAFGADAVSLSTSSARTRTAPM